MLGLDYYKLMQGPAVSLMFLIKDHFNFHGLFIHGHRPLTFQMPLHPLWLVNAPCLSVQELTNIYSPTVIHHTDAVCPACSFAHLHCHLGTQDAFVENTEGQWFLPQPSIAVSDLQHDSDGSPPSTKLLLMVQRQCAAAWACGEQVALCKVVPSSVEMRVWTGEGWPVLLSALICQIDLKALARRAPDSRCGSWLLLKREAKMFVIIH